MERIYFDAKEFKTMDWKQLNGKNLKIMVGTDTAKDGCETTCVIGYCDKNDKYYLLHEERCKKDKTCG